MRQALLLGGFPLQRDERRGVFAEVAREQLDGYVRVAVARPDFEHVACPPHGAHAALAQLFQQLEALPEHVSGSELAVLRIQLGRIRSGGELGIGNLVLGEGLTEDVAPAAFGVRFVGAEVFAQIGDQGAFRCLAVTREAFCVVGKTSANRRSGGFRGFFSEHQSGVVILTVPPAGIGLGVGDQSPVFAGVALRRCDKDGFDVGASSVCWRGRVAITCSGARPGLLRK